MCKWDNEAQKERETSKMPTANSCMNTGNDNFHANYHNSSLLNKSFTVTNYNDGKPSKMAGISVINKQTVREELAPFVRNSINGDEGLDIDQISLGESASSCARSKKVTELTELLYNSDTMMKYSSSQKGRALRVQHDEDVQSCDSRSEADSEENNPEEEAMIEERKEYESVKKLIPQDNIDLKELLEFTIEKLTKMQLQMYEMKMEQIILRQKVHGLEEKYEENLGITGAVFSEVNEVASTNVKLIQTTIKHEQEIATIRKQLEQIQSKSMKGQMFNYRTNENA